VSIQLVAYRGSAPATVDVLAGHIPLAVLDIPSSRQLILDGKLKALGVSAAKRVVFLPDVLPLSELGLSGFESVGWFGIVAPAATPPDIIRRLNAAFVKALKDPAAIEKIRVLGAEPAPSSAEAFAQFSQSESAKWGKLIGDAGIKSE
jgi:tripartite-type tricarboxylate transporter receptor subunit TctC